MPASSLVIIWSCLFWLRRGYRPGAVVSRDIAAEVSKNILR
jgi:hypothetical protein